MVILVHNTDTRLSLESTAPSIHGLKLKEFGVNVLFLLQEQSDIKFLKAVG